MRVLLYEPSGRGGMKHYTEGLAGGLARLQTDVSVLTNANVPLPSAGGYRVIRRLRDPGRPVPSLLWPLDRGLSAIYNGAIRALEADSGYDVCHLQEVAALFDWAVLRITSVPRVLTVHDVRQHESHWWKSPRLLRAVYATVDHIIVHSRHNAKVLVEEGYATPEKVSVIPHGLEPIAGDLPTRSEARRRLGLPTDVPVALSLGSIRRDKGLDVALQAIGLLDDWYLVVAGSADHPDSLVGLAVQLGVDSRVLWRIGFVPDELITSFFVASDVVVLPYKPSFESQSGVLFQAYRHHIPAVVTDVGSLGETVREDKTGVVVAPNDPQAFAKGIVSAAHMGAAIPWLSVEQKYSWDRIAEATLEVYQNLASMHSRVCGGGIPL